MHAHLHTNHQTKASAHIFDGFTLLRIERPGHGEVEIYMPLGDAAEKIAAVFNAAMGVEPAAIREPEALAEAAAADAVTEPDTTEAAE